MNIPIKILMTVILMGMVMTCSEPDSKDANPLGDLVTIDWITGDTLFVEPVNLPNIQTIDFSHLEYTDYDFSNVTFIWLDRVEQIQGQEKAVFICQYERDRESITTNHLYSYGGTANQAGIPLGQVRFYIYTVNSQTVGTIDVILRYGVFEGDTLGVDTLSIDLSHNNIIVPTTSPNMKPSILDISNGGRLRYYLNFGANETYLPMDSEIERLKKPMLLCDKTLGNYRFGSIHRATLSNSIIFSWDSDHVFHDSVSVYQVSGISD